MNKKKFVGRPCACSLAEPPFSQKERCNFRNQILINTCIALLSKLFSLCVRWNKY